MEIRPDQPYLHLSRTLQESSPAPEGPRDEVSLAMRSATPEGRVPVIVKTTEGTLFKAREEFEKTTGAKAKDELPVVDAFTAELTEDQLRRLVESRPGMLQVTVDEKVQLTDPIFLPDDQRPARPMLDNVVPTLGVEKLWERGFKGQGVTIAVIDTGIHPHPDLQGRIKGFKDWVQGLKEPYDDQGHGTHVAGDAAGNGAASDGRFVGPAPEADLVGIKALDKNGGGRFSDIIKGIQWAIQNKDRYGINIINMSLGGPIFDSYRDDPVAQAVEKAVDAGIVALVAGGNSGPGKSTIGSPGNHPEAFTVGALDDKGTASRADDTVAGFSSRGPTSIDGLTKPDILSPGVNITAANSPGSALDRHPRVPKVGRNYITISGTSMATPVMAGIVASILSANPNLTPAEVKEIFMKTAQPLPGLDANTQGAGAVNPEAALEMALARRQA